MAEDSRLRELLWQWQELQQQRKPLGAEELYASCSELLDELRKHIETSSVSTAEKETFPPWPPCVEKTTQAYRPSFLDDYSTVQGAQDKFREEYEEASETCPPAWPCVGDYEILGELGRGGMGVVYKARHEKLRRVVALKMILAGEYASAAHLTRFRTEAEAVARLQHPNVVQIYEIGEHAGLPFFSLEYCAQGSLAAKVDGTPQPPGDAAQWVEILARAMHTAHEQKIIHRDLKPGNVLLAKDGTLKITDFGLAKKLDEAGKTATGAVMGTPSYMAPEQAEGKSQELGPAVDIYALGAILYELLTGRPPFKGPTPVDTILQVIAEEPVPPSRMQSRTPRDLETICLKCLQKEPAKRYATAAALAEDLRRFQAGEPIQARPATWTERASKWIRRHPAQAAVYAMALLIAVLGVGGGSAVWLWQQAVRARDQAEFAYQQAENQRRKAEAAEQEAKQVRDQLANEKKVAEEALGREKEARKKVAEAERQLLSSLRSREQLLLKMEKE